MSIQGTSRNSPSSISSLLGKITQLNNSPIAVKRSKSDSSEVSWLDNVPLPDERLPDTVFLPQPVAQRQVFESYSDDERKIPANYILYPIMLTHKNDVNFIVKTRSKPFHGSLGVKQFEDFVDKNFNKSSQEILTSYRQENPNSNFYREASSPIHETKWFQKMTDKETRRFIATIRNKLRKDIKKIKKG